MYIYLYIYSCIYMLYILYCTLCIAFIKFKTVDSMYLQEKIIVVSRRRFCYILLKRINF